MLWRSFSPTARMQQAGQRVCPSLSRTIGQLVREQESTSLRSQRLSPPPCSYADFPFQSAAEPVTQPVAVSVFEATGSILINPWLAGQRAGSADEVVASLLSASGVATPRPQHGPALFEPDVGRQASPVSLPPTPQPLHSPYILLPCCFLASRAAITSHSCQSCWINRCCSPV